MNNEYRNWNIRLVGLPASGKSTFLARFYGYGSQSESGNSKYRISLPPDWEDDKSSEVISRLWDWVVEKYDERKPTDEEIHFNLLVDGPDTKLNIGSADCPGETFQLLKDCVSGMDEDKIRALKLSFKRDCPKLNAVLILVDSNQIGDEGNQNLNMVKSTLSALPTRADNGEPVYVLLVITKAYSWKGHEDELREKVSRLEADLAQGSSGRVKVVYCESLADLVKCKDGKRRLPDPGEISSQHVEGTLTPVDVVSTLLEMRRKYRKWRLVRRCATAIAVCATLLSAWIFMGERAEDRAYKLASTGVGLNNLASIKAYLRNDFRFCCYPRRKHLQEVVAIFEKEYLSATGNQMMAENLEEQIKTLKDINDDKSINCYISDRQTFIQTLKNFEIEAGKLRDSITKELDAVVDRVRNEVKCGEPIVEDCINPLIAKSKKVPSCEKEIRNRFAALLDEYKSSDGDSRGIVEKIGRVTNDIDGFENGIKPLIEKSYGFQCFNDRIDEALVNLIKRQYDKFSATHPWSLHMEYETIRTYLMNFSRNKTLKVIEEKDKEINEKISEMKVFDVVQKKEYDNRNDNWSEQYDLCEAAKAKLLDYTEKKNWWLSQAQALKKKIEVSKKRVGIFRAKFEGQKIEEKIAELQTFMSDGEVAPEEKKTTPTEIDQLKERRNELVKKDDELKSALTQELRTNKKREICGRAFVELSESNLVEYWQKVESELIENQSKSASEMRVLREEDQKAMDDPDRQVEMWNKASRSPMLTVEDREVARSKEGERFDQLLAISAQWTNLVAALELFRGDKRKFRYLKNALTSYDAVIAGQGRNGIVLKNHKSQLDEIRKVIIEEEARVKGLCSEYDQLLVEREKRSGIEKNSIRHQVAQKLSALLQSYESENAKIWVDAWAQNILNQCYDEMIGYERDDMDFQIAIDALGYIKEFEKAFTWRQDDASVKIQALKTAWKNENWNRVNDAAKKQDYAGAIQTYKEYLSRKQDSQKYKYEIDDYQAKQELGRKTRAFEEELHKRMEQARIEFHQRSDYDEYIKKVSSFAQDYESVVGSRSERLAAQLSALKEKADLSLKEWYVAQADSILSHCKDHYLERWEDADRLARLFAAMASDVEINRISPKVEKRMEAFTNRIESLKAKENRVSLVISDIEIEVTDSSSDNPLKEYAPEYSWIDVALNGKKVPKKSDKILRFDNGRFTPREKVGYFFKGGKEDVWNLGKIPIMCGSRIAIEFDISRHKGDDQKSVRCVVLDKDEAVTTLCDKTVSAMGTINHDVNWSSRVDKYKFSIKLHISLTDANNVLKDFKMPVTGRELLFGD